MKVEKNLFKNLKFLRKIRYFGSKNFALCTRKSVGCITIDGAPDFIFVYSLDNLFEKTV
jgi:hypothetical protein